MEIPGGAGRPALGRLSAFGRIRETVVYSATNVAQGLGRLVLAVLVILATSSEISSVLNFLLEVDGLASVRGIGLGGGGGPLASDVPGLAGADLGGMLSSMRQTKRWAGLC